MRNKKGQIWIETVIYTLIGLALIGLVLALVTPKINEFRDRLVVEQTIDSLGLIDSKISEVLSAPGNVRVINFEMQRGELFFDVENDEIRFVLDDSRSLFSEPGVPIGVGRIELLTEEGIRRHTITLTIEYSHNLIFGGNDDEEVKFSATRVPYRFSIENSGFNGIGSYDINITEVSGLGG
jgi:type II secretory pathway pseudopilin PulG